MAYIQTASECYLQCRRKEPWNSPQRGRGRGSINLKGEAKNNGSRRGLDRKVGNGALTDGRDAQD